MQAKVTNANENVQLLLNHYKVLTKFKIKLECGPMHNVIVALPNIGGALCSTPQSLADAHYWTAMQ